LVDPLRVYSNTAYYIASLTLKIVGSVVEPVPFNFSITLDPDVSAFWGDANGNGKVGLSDIFSTITLSTDHLQQRSHSGRRPFHRLHLFDDRQWEAAVFTSFDGFLGRRRDGRSC
jgi:hypothetical protein